MFAIVNIAGQQFKVAKDQEIFVHRLEGESGDKVEFSEVLLQVDDNNKVVTGKDLKSTVKAEIITHALGDKVTALKKKRRKGYRRKFGFRQHFTKIRISEIA
ncbi:MAG TPA: 50S ribosomal protein L21 [Chitinophagaceae bacterium]|nr:50S ribosomal protein L21 [Chitinophagaceae bacterium]